MAEEIKFARINGGVWSPVFTLPKNEKKLYGFLRKNGIPAYLPLRKHINIQPVISKGKSYRYKRVLHLPMFSNYIFANLSPDSRLELIRNRSVIRVLPVTKPQEDTLIAEMETIRQLELYSEENDMDIDARLVKGTRVRFIDGKFSGWEGVVLDSDQGMAYINITSLEASARIHYPSAWCQVIGE